MYADFSMTDTGDIFITEDNPNKELKVSILYSKYKGQKISFYIRGLASEKTIDNRTLKVSFDMFNKTNEIKFICYIIIDIINSFHIIVHHLSILYSNKKLLPANIFICTVCLYPFL